VCITRKGNPALRDCPRIAARKTIFLHLLSLPSRLITSTCGRTDNSETQDLANSWDDILIPAQDATQRRGAATTRREAGLGAKGVTKINTGTTTSKHQDPDPTAHRQLTRRHKRCKPDGREHGDITHNLHPWQAQPANTLGPYNPYNVNKDAATARLDKKLRQMPKPLTRFTRYHPLGKET